MILGFDPGTHGAVALLTEGGAVVHAWDVPTVTHPVGKTKRTRIAAALLSRRLRDLGAVEHAFVERVGAMPGQGTASMFAFGYAAGLLEGLLAGLAVPITFVTPVTWKRAMQVGPDKGRCRARAMELWPAQAELFARVKDDGRAEAALVALYGLRTMQRAAA